MPDYLKARQERAALEVALGQRIEAANAALEAITLEGEFLGLADLPAPFGRYQDVLALLGADDASPSL